MLTASDLPLNDGTLEISVVICTYNRADVLGYCLENMQNQTASADRYEVLIINNNCTDASSVIIDKYVKRNPNFKCIQESRQGLSYARNSGWQQARATYVAYMDDDARAGPTWIETAVDIIHSHSPDIFGGPVTPYHTSAIPEWFRPQFGSIMHQSSTGWMPKGAFVSGMNIVFKKELLRTFGGFTIERGMTAGQLVYGDESEIITYAHNHGRRIYYSLDLMVEHHVPEYKKNIAFRIYNPYRMGRDANYFIEGRTFSFADLLSLPDSVDELMSAIGGGLRQRDETKYPFIESYILDHVSKPANRIGGIVEFFQQNPIPDLGDALRWYNIRRYRMGTADLIRAIVLLLKMWLKSTLRQQAPDAKAQEN